MQTTRLLRSRKTLFPPKIVLALLAVYILWGSIYLAIAFALESYPPLLASGIRFFVGGSLLGAYLLYRHEAMPTRTQWRRAIGMSTIMIVISMGGTAIAQQSISSSLAAIIAATIPAWTALFVGFMGRWSNRREWFGIALGFLGIILINIENLGSSNLFGILLMTFVAMSWAFGTSLKSRQKSASTLADSMAEMVCGGALLLLLSFVRGEQVIGTPTVNATMGLLYMTLFGSSLVYVAYIYLVQNVPPSIATSNAYVNPAIAVLLGLYIGETIAFTTWIALGFIIASVIVLLRDKRTD